MLRAYACARLVALSLAVVATSANAASQRTFVASTGVDNPSCSLASPCRTFTAAVAAASFRGEVIVLDSAGCGTVTINKSIAIIAPPGVYAGITVAGASDGVTINTAGADVRLKGLALNGLPGSSGIRFIQGATLAIENCTLTYFTNHGISIEGTGTISIADTSAVGNGGAGLNITAAATVEVARSRFERNTTGVHAENGASTSIFDTIVSNNNGHGIEAAQQSAGMTQMAIESSMIADNTGGTGVIAMATNVASAESRVQIARSTVVRNINGIYSVALGGTTRIIATANPAADNSQFGFASLGTNAKLRAALNSSTGNQSGFSQSGGGALYTPGNNLVRDNTTDDAGRTADTPL